MRRSYSASVKGAKSNAYAKCKVCYNGTYLHPCIVRRLLHATCVTPSPSSGDREGVLALLNSYYAAYRESDDEYVPSVVMMCGWMEVSRSRFYEWRTAPESATAKRRGMLALIVQKSFDESDGTYGYRRVHADLVAWGVPAGPELVRSIMREPGTWSPANRGRGGSA